MTGQDEPSPALVIAFPEPASDTAAVDRDRLVGLLADFEVVAIHEDDVLRSMQWTVHFGDTLSRDAARTALRAAADYRDLRLDSIDVADEDWARRTQADLPAIRIGRIVVAPPWDIPSSTDQRARSDETVIVIEPSRGFGTGHHQSTRLCLVLLQDRDIAGRSVIDVGTGSGVLAVAAARLGAAYVSAIDVDPDAIENARENAVRNGVGGAIDAHVRDLADARLLPADLVTANLTGALLERHATDLMALVKPGGVLIASGFTVDERDRVIAAFEPRMSLVGSAEEDDWWAIVVA